MISMLLSQSAARHRRWSRGWEDLRRLGKARVAWALPTHLGARSLSAIEAKTGEPSATEAALRG